MEGSFRARSVSDGVRRDPSLTLRALIHASLRYRVTAKRGKPDRWCYDFGLAQSGLRSGLEIDDFQLQAAPALPIIEGRGENEAALTAGGHQFRCPFGQVEADRGKT